MKNYINFFSHPKSYRNFIWKKCRSNLSVLPSQWMNPSISSIWEQIVYMKRRGNFTQKNNFLSWMKSYGLGIWYSIKIWCQRNGILVLFERRSKNQIPDIEPDNGVVYRRNRNPRQISSTNEQNQNDNSTPGQSGFSHSLEVNAHDTATHTHTLTAFQLWHASQL